MKTLTDQTYKVLNRQQKHSKCLVFQVYGGMRYSEFIRGIDDSSVTVFPFKPAAADARSTGVVIDEHTGYQVQFSKDLL